MCPTPPSPSTPQQSRPPRSGPSNGGAARGRPGRPGAAPSAGRRSSPGRRGERRRLGSCSLPPPCLLRADTATATARAASRGRPEPGAATCRRSRPRRPARRRRSSARCCPATTSGGFLYDATGRDMTTAFFRCSWSIFTKLLSSGDFMQWHRATVLHQCLSQTAAMLSLKRKWMLQSAFDLCSHCLMSVPRSPQAIPVIYVTAHL